MGSRENQIHTEMRVCLLLRRAKAAAGLKNERGVSVNVNACFEKTSLKPGGRLAVSDVVGAWSTHSTHIPHC